MSDLEIVQSDTLKTVEFPITDENEKAENLTGGEVRLFALGALNGDRPATTANIVRSGTLTSGSKAVTISPTSLVIGMRVTGTGIPAGTEIEAVGAGITLSRPATANGSNSLTFWNGVLGDVSVSPTLGIARFQGLGALLDLGTALRQTYTYYLRYKNSAGKIGFSDEDTFVGRVSGS